MIDKKTLLALVMAGLAGLAVAGGSSTIVYAQTTGTAQDYTTLIVSVSMLIGSISGIISIFASRYLASHQDSKIAKEIVNGTDWLAGTDDRIIQHADDITTAIEIVGRLSPEVQKELERHQVDANSLRQKAETYKVEVDRARELAEKVL